VHIHSDDFDIEQEDILQIIKAKERATETSGETKAEWVKFNGDLACRVVKQFLKMHMPTQVKVVGPGVYVEGYPAEFDLMLVSESAIPAAFTNAYRNSEVQFVIQVGSHSLMAPDNHEELLSQFRSLREQYPTVNCTHLAIREDWNPNGEKSTSYIEEVKRAFEPQFRVFCLAEHRAYNIIPGQWREFVSHLANTSPTR
jgi:hypothetical protein